MDIVNESASLPTSLKRIGIERVEQALLVAPEGYRDCTSIIAVLPVPDTNVDVFIRLTVEEIEFETQAGSKCSRDDRKAHRVRGILLDELGGRCSFMAFDKLNLWRTVHPGDVVHLHGLFTTFSGYRTFYGPVLVDPEDVGRVVPIYKGKPGLAGAESIALGVQLARAHLSESAQWLLQKTGLPRREFVECCGLDPEQVLSGLHWPESMDQATVALAAARQVSIRAVEEQVRRQRERPIVPASSLPISTEMAIELARDHLARLPFDATVDQRRAIWHILQDLQSEVPMRRMLSGDVGTGKTVAFFVPAVIAYKAGWSVAILAPNRSLVEQIVEELRGYYPEVPVVQVVSGVKLENGAIQQHAIFVGTTALVLAAENAGRKFKFLISDEQQKFSIDQRQALVGPDGNVLESTATAIPRTVALVSLGGWDVSELRQSPVHKDIRSRIARKHDATKLFAFVKTQVQKGGQVAVIYPLAEHVGDDRTAKKGALDPRRSVEAAMMRFAAHFGERVGLIHGKLKPAEKTETLRKMRCGELSVLVSSTVIEIGLTMPSLRVVVVVNPERFGISQLHQLRGRLARHGGRGYFFMLDLDGALQPNTDALRRMTLLEGCNDGFELAIRDAEVRGAGEIFNEFGQQSGATRGIFYGIHLTYNDIERAALEAAYRGAGDSMPPGIRSTR